MLRMLFAAGADPNAKNNNGDNALADLNWTEDTIPAAIALLEGGVSGTHSSIVKKHKRTLIHWAVLWDSHELFQAARKAGVSVTERDKDKETPLLLAVNRGNAWFVRELLAAGAPVNGSASYFGQLFHDENSLHLGTDDLLAQAVQSTNLEIVEILLKAGVNLNTRSNTYYQGTALHLAIEANRPDMVAAILHAGAQPNVTDRYDETPLRRAVDANNVAIVELLLKAGADPTVKDKDGNTLLKIAKDDMRDPRIIQLLEGG
jgi:ankyrin repeat protein